MTITINQIKKLRELTGAAILDCRQVLEETGGDTEAAMECLRKRGMVRAEKKEGRETKAGLISVYQHTTGKVGVLIEVACETDFVARTDDFQNFTHEICLQVASMNPKGVEELLAQEYIREPKKKISDVLTELIAKTGENIVIKRFCRLELGI